MGAYHTIFMEMAVYNWIRTRNVETLHPVSTVLASLSASFSAFLKQGAMEAGF